MHVFKNAPIHELNQFVERSTMADTKEDVVRFLLYFLIQYDTTEEVKHFIKELLHDEEALNKVVIVNEHELYETVVMMTNKQMWEHSLFQRYKRKAETVFLYVRIQGKEEDEIKDWKTQYEKTQSTIIDLVLDEYLLLKKCHQFTHQHKYRLQMNKWEDILKVILSEKKDR